MSAAGVLEVSGGQGGTNALLEDLDRLAVALGVRGASFAGLALGTGRVAASPALVAASVLDVAGAVSVQRELARSTAGLLQLGSDVAALAAAVAGAAGAYRAVDGASAAAWDAARASLVAALEPALVVGAGVLATGAVVVAGASVGAGAAAAAQQLARPAATPSQAVATGREVAGATAVELVQGVGTRLVTAVPLPLREVVVEQGLAATGVPAPVLAAGLLAVAAPFGVWGSTTSTVRAAGPPVRSTPAATTGELLLRVHGLSPKEGAQPGSVRVDRISRPGGAGGAGGAGGGTVAVVHLPSTQVWFPTRGPNPVDGETNVRSVAGQGTAVSAGVSAAMRAAGVRRGEPVMLVGYSQGGLTAAQLAADPRFRAEFSPRVVLTAGSPIAHMPVPDDVSVLALEHDGDYVHGLDGADNPDRASWTTVEAASGEPAHSAPGYAATADLVDASEHPSLLAWREEAAPFLADPSGSEAVEVTTTTWVLTRTGQNSPSTEK